MTAETTPRRVVVTGAVLCGLLFVLLAAPPTAAVTPSSETLDDTGGAGDADAGASLLDHTGGETAAVRGDATNCDGESARGDGVADGTYTAVLDRIEADLAVLEVSDDEGDTHELVVEAAELPAAGRHPNAVFEVRVEGGALLDATYDASRSEARLEAAQDRFDGLASQPQDEGEDEDTEGE